MEVLIKIEPLNFVATCPAHHVHDAKLMWMHLPHMDC